MSNERTKLVAPCGIDCGICELHICKDNPQLMEVLLQKGIPKEKLPCSGCRDVKGNCPVHSEVCKTYSCSKQKEVEFCYKCSDFPCAKLQPAADQAEILPHNLKVFLLSTIKRVGVEEFTKQSSLIKARYYKGKMVIGEGPQL